MKFKITEEIKEYQPKNEYLLEITTMTGDADDYHTISKYFKDENELKQAIIYCEVLGKQYPGGMWGGADYNHLNFFKEGEYEYDDLFEDWFYDDYGDPDQYKYYKVYYFDNDSKKFKVQVELDEEDTKEIEKYPIKK